MQFGEICWSLRSQRAVKWVFKELGYFRFLNLKISRSPNFTFKISIKKSSQKLRILVYFSFV